MDSKSTNKNTVRSFSRLCSVQIKHEQLFKVSQYTCSNTFFIIFELKFKNSLIIHDKTNEIHV